MKLQGAIWALLWCLCGVVGFDDEVKAPEWGSYVKRTMPAKDGPKKKEVQYLWKPTTVSYYADFFHGRRMANGERFNNYGHNGIPTVAHKTLPYGTLVEFKNPSNGRKVLTRVADRGPFVDGRQFDLNQWAAVKLGIKKQGVARIVYATVGRVKGKSKRNSTQGHS